MSVQETYLAAIADAIREKEGSTGVIPAKEFAARILALDITPPEPVEPLPDNAQRVEYVEFNYNSYVDTGIIPDPSTFHINIEMMVTQLSTSYVGILCYASSRSNDYRIYQSSKSLSIRCGTASVYNFTMCPINEKVMVDVDGPNQTINFAGEEKNAQVGSYAMASTLFLGNGGLNAASYETLRVKMYSAKIYVNNVLQRNFVPCVKTDGTAALYDKVSNQFFISLGNGSLIAGPSLTA